MGELSSMATVIFSAPGCCSSAAAAAASHDSVTAIRRPLAKGSSLGTNLGKGLANFDLVLDLVLDAWAGGWFRTGPGGVVWFEDDGIGLMRFL